MKGEDVERYLRGRFSAKLEGFAQLTKSDRWLVLGEIYEIHTIAHDIGVSLDPADLEKYNKINWRYESNGSIDKGNKKGGAAAAASAFDFMADILGG